MAILDSNSITFLPQPLQSNLVRAWSENIDLLRYLSVRPSAQRGNLISWLVDVGAPVALPFPDGYAVQQSEFTIGNQIALVAPWAEYRSPFQATRRTITVMAGAQGIPDALNDIVGNETVRHAARIAGQVESDLWTGSGTGDRILGLNNVFVQSGSVYGKALSTYPSLQAIRQTGFGTASEAKLAQVEQQLFQNHGVRPNLIVMAPDVMTKLANDGIINVRREYMNNAPIDISVRPDSFTFQGIPCIRVRSMASGSLAMLNTNSMHLEYMIEPKADADAVFLSIVSMVGSSRDGQMLEDTGLPLILFALGKDGPSRKYSLDTPSFQLVCDAPFMNALVEGITVTIS